MKIIGTGELNWHASERRSDRYGAIRLYKDASLITCSSEGVPVDFTDLNGKTGKLVATVVSTKVSEHIGDLFRGLYPSTPEIGEIIQLGRGTFFRELKDNNEYFGLQPSDDRLIDWLNPESLYRCHQQTVTVTFEETP